MGIEQANNWRARRTNSIKLRTSDQKRHEIEVSQGEGETDPAKIADMQARREAARAAAVQREKRSRMRSAVRPVRPAPTLSMQCAASRSPKTAATAAP